MKSEAESGLRKDIGGSIPEVTWVDVRGGLRDCFVLFAALITASVAAIMATGGSSSHPTSIASPSSGSSTLSSGMAPVHPSAAPAACRGHCISEWYQYGMAVPYGTMSVGGSCQYPFTVNQTITGWAELNMNTGAYSWVSGPTVIDTITFNPGPPSCYNEGSGGTLNQGVIYDSNGAPGIDTSWNPIIKEWYVFGGTAELDFNFLSHFYSDNKYMFELQIGGSVEYPWTEIIDLFIHFIV